MRLDCLGPIFLYEALYLLGVCFQSSLTLQPFGGHIAYLTKTLCSYYPLS